MGNLSGGEGGVSFLSGNGPWLGPGVDVETLADTFLRTMPLARSSDRLGLGLAGVGNGFGLKECSRQFVDGTPRGVRNVTSAPHASVA